MWLHFQITSNNYQYSLVRSMLGLSEEDELGNPRPEEGMFSQEEVKLNMSIPVTKYMKKVKERKTMNLLNDVPAPKEKEE
mmetsp:Transcript_27927/g.20921  ORF Transcript_27927/g.20921 Transcript_27927/m.20921 type:complete len:80 (+) Transcript_27927:416-655(+)